MTSKRNGPFFIIGNPRSGTTLVRLILTSHSQLVVPPECAFIIWLAPHFGNWGTSEFSDRPSVRTFAQAVAESRKFDTWNISAALIEEEVARLVPVSYADACAAIYRLYARRIGKPAAEWGDKNNYYLNHVSALKVLYPAAGFIHVVRDGRDVACSYREVMEMQMGSPYRPRLPVRIADIAEEWANNVRLIRSQFGELEGGSTIELRYEDLATAPEAQTRRLCNWLGVAFEPAMLQFHEANKLRNLEPQATMEWKRRTLEPVSDKSVGRHASALSRAEEDRFLAVAETELRHYGYLSRV